MPNKLVRVNAKTTQLYDILFEPNENIEMTFTTGGKEAKSVKLEQKLNLTILLRLVILLKDFFS